ncbi:MAG TPA: hypothetical protein VFX43_09410 [Chitinophagaceae bacterium]|nr:hypothetical protein [Chitinophagaceae bacterium]
MSISYTPGVPNATDTIPATQVPIQNNFLSLNQQFSVDHLALTNGSPYGEHIKVTLNLRNSDPSASADGPILYSKNVTKNELFIEPTSGQGSVIQLTNINKGTGTATGTPAGFVGATYYSEYSFLPGPGGFVIMSGNVLIGAYVGSFTNVPVVFPIAFTTTSTLSVVVTGLRGTTTDSNPVNVSDLTTGGFTIRSNSTSYKGYSWIAMGT